MRSLPGAVVNGTASLPRHQTRRVGRVSRAFTRPAAPASYHVAVVVWGDWYARAYLDLSLPTQLAVGNLPALAQRGEVIYRLYAASDARRQIESSTLLSSLRAIAHVEIKEIPRPSPEAPVLSYASRWDLDAAVKAREDNAALVFLRPDNGLSDGSLTAMADAIAAGNRAVVASGPKVSARALQELRRPNSSRGEIALSGRDVSEMIVAHPHKELQTNMWGAQDFARWPGTLAWNVPGEGLLIHSFFLHPLAIWLRPDGALPTPENLAPNTSTDGMWIARAVPNLHEIHVARESAEIALFSVDGEDKSPGTRGRCGVLDVAVWARDYCSSHHLAFARMSIAFRTGPPSAAWLRTERRADRIIRSVHWLVRSGCLGADYWHVDKSIARARLADIKRNALNRIRAASSHD